MGQAILNETQKKIIAAVAKEPKLTDFYLTGGTALAAYYLYHRISEDLDFFVFNEPDMIFLHGFIERQKSALGANNVRFERLYDRNQFFFAINKSELKVEFTKYPFLNLEQPIGRDGVKIDSLTDIAANKLMALLDRFDPKDFVDLYFILQKFNLDDIRVGVEKKFGIKVNNIFLGGEFSKVKRIEALPKMLKPLTIGKLKKFFSETAKNLGPQIFKD